MRIIFFLLYSIQAFVRDPDGYYIEFCNCASLEQFLHKKMEEVPPWTLSQATSMAKAKKIFKKRVNLSKQALSLKAVELTSDSEVKMKLSKI